MEWARTRVDQSDGVWLLSSLSWEMAEATCVAKTDACPRGIAFWYPQTGEGFTAPTPHETLSLQIVFYEALTILSALDHAHQQHPPKSKVVIFTDNFATVAMFSSLRALPEFNCILKWAADILLKSQIDLQVLHIAGDRNDVADALSRGEFVQVLKLQPGLTIRVFEPYHRADRRQSPPLLQPPHQPLGAAAC